MAAPQGSSTIVHRGHLHEAAGSKGVVLLSLSATYSPEELKLLEACYGTPPALLAGIEHICNTKRKSFTANLMETTADLTSHQPIRANLAYALVHVADMFKVHALLDTRSTHMLISKVLVDLVPEVSKQVVPKTMGFR